MRGEDGGGGKEEYTTLFVFAPLIATTLYAASRQVHAGTNTNSK